MVFVLFVVNPTFYRVVKVQTRYVHAIMNTVTKRSLNLTFVSFVLFVVGYARSHHEGHEEHEELAAQ